jgi:endonuclease YncB( thermonuclease family)
MLKIIVSYTILLIGLFPLSAVAEGEVKVVDVFDGDTLIVSLEGRAEIIKLFGVDSPEKEQPFGLEARGFSSEMVSGRVIQIIPMEKSRYEMVKVYYENKCLNEELLKAGYAWYNINGSIDERWVQMEQQARYERKGLWSEDNPVPPWQYLSSKSKPTLDRSYTIKFPSKHESFGSSATTKRPQPATPRRKTPKK